MRPENLYSLFKPSETLAGVGEKHSKHIETLCNGNRIIDLIWHIPNNVILRKKVQSLANVNDNQFITFEATVSSHNPSHNSRGVYRVYCHDENGGEITLTFFHVKGNYLEKQLPIGEKRVVSGKAEYYGALLQMPHPDYILPLNRANEIPEIEPVYPLTAGLSLKVFGKIIKHALDEISMLPEWLDGHHIKQEHWQSWESAIKSIHNPTNQSDVFPNNKARRRLAYDELLAGQLALALVRDNSRKLKGRYIKGDGILCRKALAELKFDFTNAQKRVMREIFADMASEDRMLRLLQGDVGSGKTIVAFFSMLNAIETGLQTAIMTPTDILARQHFLTLKPLAEAAGVSIALLTGRIKGKERKQVLENLKNGKIDITVGTHALFQDDVDFKDLGFAVIDEQHRFGVHQRLELAAKGRAPDILVMTATPIPRTMVLTCYGDMESSCLDEMPKGREPVETKALPTSRLDDVINAVKRALEKGAKIYWVCPLVEDTGKSELAAAETRAEELLKIFPEKVGLIHGRLKTSEKEKVMDEFSNGNIKILVATTVIEVGIDVPDATVMIIEHAERFGLSQLHQLRGRVGRSNKKSSCLLLYSTPLSETAKARIDIMRQTEDGFLIAEEDLKIRGGGEILGTKQSGIPDFRIADLAFDSDLLNTARSDAKLILNRDPKLTSTRGKALKTLLYLFERDVAVKTLMSG